MPQAPCCSVARVTAWLPHDGATPDELVPLDALAPLADPPPEVPSSTLTPQAARGNVREAMPKRERITPATIRSIGRHRLRSRRADRERSRGCDICSGAGLS